VNTDTTVIDDTAVRAFGTRWSLDGGDVLVLMEVVGRCSVALAAGVGGKWPGWGYAAVCEDADDGQMPPLVDVRVPLSRWGEFVAAVVDLLVDGEDVRIYPNRHFAAKCMLAGEWEDHPIGQALLGTADAVRRVA